MKRLHIAIILIFTLLVGGCQMQNKTANTSDEPLTDFKQIEGITEEEIAQVEAALKNRDKLVWSAVEGASYFLENGQPQGSTVLIANHIGDLFDVDIEVTTGKFVEVRNFMLSGQGDITAELVPEEGLLLLPALTFILKIYTLLLGVPNLLN